MKIYTKGGDKGETSLLSGLRVAKSDPRLNAYGTVDELNSVLGVCLSDSGDTNISDLVQLLKNTQHRLFVIGSYLACDAPEIAQKLPAFKEIWITELEQAIDKMDAEMPPLKQFIIPGGTKLASHLHLARTVCRRAERHCSALHATGQEGLPWAIRYLNRLSDYFFVAARFANFRAKTADIPWSKDI